MKPLSTILILAAVTGRMALGASQLQLRNLDVGDQGSARFLAADGAGNLFAVSTYQGASGLAWTRVIKTDPNGSPLATFDLPGGNPGKPAADAQGNLIVVGFIEPISLANGYAVVNFPLVNPLFPTLKYGGAYVLKLDAGLQTVLFSTFLDTLSAASAAALDSAGNIYVTGTTTAADFPVTAGA